MASATNWLRTLLRQNSNAPQAPQKQPVEQKQLGAHSLIAVYGQGQPVWTPRDYTQLAREGFMQNAIVYRSIRMIAEAAASIPWILFEDEQRLDQHPLLNLLIHPNSRHSGVDLLEAWYSFLLSSGNSYLNALSDQTNIHELHVLRPDRMKLVPDNNGQPESYIYTVNEKVTRFHTDPATGLKPILHLSLFHPLNDYYGMSPLEAAATATDIHNAASAWNKSLLDNSARPSGALVFTGANGQANLTDEQFTRLKQELETSFEGPGNAGRPLLLEGGLDWKEMGFSPKDMDFINAKHTAAREIALAFGVPPMLLGIPGDNTFSNYAEANKNFWRQTVIPLANRTGTALTHWLSPIYGGQLRLSPDINQLDALAQDRASRWKRIQESDFLTTNEKRRAVGYPPLEDGDQLNAT